MAEWVNDVSPEDDSHERPRVPPDSIRIGKHMTAERLPVDPHDVYTVLDKRGETLGYAEWYPKWKRYVFLPDQDSAFSADCLRSLAMFLSRCTRTG